MGIETLNEDLELVIPMFQEDMDIIAKLDDEPNAVGGLTAAELKAEFDRPGKTIQKYLNEVLVPSLSGTVAEEEVRARNENQRVFNENQRVSNENERVAAEESRVAADSDRMENENIREENEARRNQAETERLKAEYSRVKDEQARAEAETARAKAEVARDEAERARAEETSGIVARATEQAEKAEAAAETAAQVKNMTVLASSLPAGTEASVNKTVTNGVLTVSFGIPIGERGEAGPRGHQGEPGSPGKDGRDGQDGAPGEGGVTFVPHVSEDGVISWTNNGGQANPAPVSVKGQRGEQGIQGPKGETGSGFTVLDYYDTLADLEDSVPNPSVGDAYGIGTAEPYDIYIYGETSGWVNNGPLFGGGGGGGNSNIIVIPAGWMKGDMDRDGAHTGEDVTALMQYSISTDKDTASMEFLVADVNGDGYVDAADANPVQKQVDGSNSLGYWCSDVLGNWQVNPNYGMEEAQFYTVVDAPGVTPESSGELCLLAYEGENLYTNAVPGDGNVTVYARRCPVHNTPAYVNVTSEVGSAWTITSNAAVDVKLRQNEVELIPFSEWWPDMRYDGNYLYRIEGKRGTSETIVDFVSLVNVDDEDNSVFRGFVRGANKITVAEIIANADETFSYRQVTSSSTSELTNVRVFRLSGYMDPAGEMLKFGQGNVRFGGKEGEILGFNANGVVSPVTWLSDLEERVAALEAAAGISS